MTGDSLRPQRAGAAAHAGKFARDVTRRETGAGCPPAPVPAWDVSPRLVWRWGLDLEAAHGCHEQRDTRPHVVSELTDWRSGMPDG